MQIGLTAGGPNLARTIEDARKAEAEGFAAYAMPGDSTLTFALIGAQTERIRLVTAVVPIFGHHPSYLAAQARAAQEASRGRFTLGIGLSHQVSIEGALGISFSRPADRMEEYLRILVPLLRGEPVDFSGDFYTYRGGSRSAGGGLNTSCVVAALGPMMLRLCGKLSAGTILWMANARSIEDYVAPRLRRASNAAGIPNPETIAGLPVALTNHPQEAREQANLQFANYGRLPSYRGILDRGGAATPGDAVLVGNEAELDRELDRLEQAGVTLFNAALFRTEQGGPARTREYLASRARDRAAKTQSESV